MRSHHSGSTVDIAACTPSFQRRARPWRSSMDTSHPSYAQLGGHRDGADHQRVNGAVVGDLSDLAEGHDKLVALVLQAGIEGAAVIGGNGVGHVRILPVPFDRLADLDRHIVRSEPAN